MRNRFSNIKSSLNDQATLSVSYNKAGDVQRAQGNLKDALNAYQASLAVIERLTKSNPGNAKSTS
jgi:hypothetical protein